MRSRDFVGAALATTLFAGIAPAQRSPLIGHRGQELPAGFRSVDLAAIVVPRPIGWNVVEGSGGTWLALSIPDRPAPDSIAGAALVDAPVVDAVAVQVAPGAMILFADCTLGAAPDPLLAAMVQPQPSGRPKVLAAWRPDFESRRIAEVPAAQVTCELVPEE